MQGHNSNNVADYDSSCGVFIGNALGRSFLCDMKGWKLEI